MIIFSLVVSLLLYMKESSFKRRLVTSRLTLFVGPSVRLQSIFKKFWKGGFVNQINIEIC